MNRLRFTVFSILTMVVFNLGCVKERIVDHEAPEPQRTLVLLTDMAEGSDVVVRFKGRIGSEFPNVMIHYVPVRPFSVKEAAYILEVAARSYPAGTCFAGLVEPGAAGKRMVFQTDGNKKFLLPDNGLATRLLHSLHSGTIYQVQNPDVLAGKDYSRIPYEELYTEATLSMLAEVALSEFGPVLSQPTVWEIQEPTLTAAGVEGEILFSDSFGNCVTNIPDSLMTAIAPGALIRVATAANSFLVTFGSAYSSVPAAENVAFVNGSSRVELAVNQGNLSARYGIGAGTYVRLQPAVAKIGILRYNTSATSEAITARIKARLTESGLIDGQNIQLIEKNALGQISLLPGLARDLMTAGIDILVPVSTPASQAAVQNVAATIPIVFTFVTDPASAGILNQRAHVTGLSDGINFNQLLQFTKNLLPELSVTGRIFCENEANSRYAQTQLIALAPLYGLVLQSAVITTAADVPAAYQQIKDKNLGAVLIADDNTVNAAMPDLVQLALTDHIPVLGDEIDHVRAGALASISIDMEHLAIQTADKIVAVLRGVEPDDLPVQRFDADVIAINTQTAARLNYAFPEDIKAAAKYIFP